MNTKALVGVLFVVVVLAVGGYVYMSNKQNKSVTPTSANNTSNYVDPISGVIPTESAPSTTSASTNLASNSGPMPVDETMAATLDASIDSEISAILTDMAIDNTADYSMELGL